MAQASLPHRAPVTIDQLRLRLSPAEQVTGLIRECCAPVELGIAAIDAALGRGLACAALHEIAAVRESEASAATGFALAVAARFSAANPRSALLWIAEDRSVCENGAPYGPGIDAAGIPPDQLITVAAARARDVLWAMEEALRCRAVGAVIGELRARDIDEVATRRLALAAAAGNALGLFLRTAPNDDHSAAVTRWVIGAAPSASPTASGRGVGAP